MCLFPRYLLIFTLETSCFGFYRYMKNSSSLLTSKYFAGEGQFSIFGLGDLRPSQEWISNKWNHMKDRQDVANSLLSDMEQDNRLGLSSDGDVPVQASGMEVEVETQRGSLVAACKPPSTLEHSVDAERVAFVVAACKPPPTLEQSEDAERGASVPNLSEVCHLDSLKWSSSRKRRRGRELGKGSSRSKRQCGSGSGSSSSQEEAEAASNACSKILLPKSMTVVDTDNCKIRGSDPMLVTPMALCSNLVLSQ